MRQWSPDGEQVDYGYDIGGQVVSVVGSHYGHDFVYVSDIGYDEFGQRAYIEYGTGVRTDYEYDPNRRWLSSIATAKAQKKYQNISYSFDLVGNVLGYTNDCTSGGGYRTLQSYSYDSLYQLISATGSTRYEPVAGGAVPEHESTYTQAFAFDILGNMTSKTSTETVFPNKTVGDALNYSINFSYAEGFAHRLDHAGQRYYAYDADGNVVRERNEAMPDSSGTDIGSDDDEWDDWDDWGDGLGEAGFGFGMGGSGSGSGEGGSGTASSQATVYERIYEWDERDRLTGSTEGNTVVGYVYGEDGNRTNKYSSSGETVYFNNLWTWHDAKSLGSGGQTSKNIYLGTERIVSKLNRGEGLDTYSEEYHKTYYWHSDHLGSAHFITDYQGNEYQRIEYTPYGEEWVELKSDTGDLYLPYKFTGKERDEETGLYYYGARYLDPVYSRWLSTDPAVGDYIPTVGGDNSKLPGMGGVFNTVNMQLYHYANNNPLRYIDPNGSDAINFTKDYILLRLEIALVIPLYDKNGNRQIDHNGQKKSVEIDTLVVKPNEYACGAFDGGKNKNSDYFKVTAKDGIVVSFIVTEDSIYFFDGGLLNFFGDVKKFFDNIGKKRSNKEYKEYSGFKKAGSKGAAFLEAKWGKTFDEDLKDENGNIMTMEEAYNTDKQLSLRYYLNQIGRLSTDITTGIE